MRLLALVGLAVVVACGQTPAPASTNQPLDIPPLPPEAAAKPTTPPPAPIATDSDARDEFDEARDPIAKRPKRALALVVAESQQLEMLLSATPATAPDRPMIAKRTAETLLELARQKEGDDAKQLRMKAAAHLSDIAQNSPKFAQLDEVYYLLGLTDEQIGDSMNARKTYFQLINQRPNSKEVPYAYFAFGEIFRREGAQDPAKYDLARQAYAEVLKYPQSDIQPYAKRRIDALPTR